MKKDCLCIIPARAGSKGVKNKNFKLLNGKPLIQYTIDVAKKIRTHCDIVVSSDHKKIKKICKKNKLEFFGFRPKRLSGDFIETIDVVRYELKKLEKIKKKIYKKILLLQPTCPIRNKKKISKALSILEKKKYESVISVCDVGSFHPYRMKMFKKGKIVNFIKDNKENMKPRQKLPKIYIRSGSIYASKRHVITKNKSLVGKNCYGLVLEGLETINIDSINDFDFLKKKLKKHN